MDISILQTVVSGVAGLVAGAIASLVAPWVNWGIEKRKIRLQRRAQLVDQWRKIVNKAEFNPSDLLNHPAYGPLRGLLSEDVRNQLERPGEHLLLEIGRSPFDNPDRQALLREIARIEKKWRLA